ncbi:tRNA U-34 5-methylaminomethyl-2-thiouridine biosynthesis protein [Sporosarcina sp. GW1-11]|uniref:tRNA U-34 5-methylaminomethyl-2-thiouridine biosynthesis protein n=1 Tax=Sporosarcina sp. GW1-11 TaxID=2899126 RepID=UPI00294C6427|nr:tRNA U-34 5-methylaminomethyl-2-thiouridine biosynthesis protein [Sporosarcina sp. GW1-11]MDV6379279.1 tRNA U-34 5-methylaminomethyl-2-thiouridine biosynthesis protein [Sporosarcina sp. GW1-11]
MSKSIIGLIAGILSAWLVISIITKSFDSDSLLILLLGVFMGYGIGKKEQKD